MVNIKMTKNNKDWIGNKNSIFKTLGASNHTEKERQNEDYYATDPIAIDVLIKDGGVTFTKPVWECACGEGHLSERLKEYGCKVVSTDLVNRGYGKGEIDFLTYNDHWNGDIITNPLYKYAKEFIEHAIEIVNDGCRVFMFLILCAKNALFDEMRAGGGSAVAYAWYEFEKGYKGETVLKWIN